MRKLCFLFVALLATTSLWAHDFEVDGIYYNDLDGNNVQVTHRGYYDNDYDNEYAGAVIIPETVTYNGTTYSVTSIGVWAFHDCSSLTSITIPNSVTSIGSSTFSGCSKLTSVTINSDAIVNKAYSSTSNISRIFGSQVTEYIIGDDVNGIGNYAFCRCSSLTSVTIPNSVTNIGDHAFNSCSSLTSITIPNSVTSIGSSAFKNCSSLTSVTIGNSVTSIGNDAFNGCSKLSKTNYTGDIAAWCDIKFGNPSANPMNYSHNFYINDVEIKDLVIPNSVDSIHNYAFYECSSLTSITIPNSVTSIGNSAFYYCSSLTSVTIGNSVTSIGDWAFYHHCSKLTSVTINSDAIVNKSYSSSSNISDIFGSQVTKYIIGDMVKGIGNSAFYDCSSLTSVTIPNSVTSIGSFAFDGCSSLTKTNYAGDIAGWCDIKFGNSSANPMNYSHNFYINDVEIKDLVIPNSVDSIHNYAFYVCSSLTSVTIGNSVTSIGDDAFNDCSSLTKTNYAGDIAGWCDIKFGNSLANPIYYSHNFYNNDVEIKDLVIPNNVTSIGSYAFNGCSKLTSVTCEAETPPTVGQYAFDGVSISIPVYVPCGCVEAYKAKSSWKDFTNIQEPLAEYLIEVNVNDTIMGSAKVDYNTFCEGAQISATANYGYHFVRWSDGNTNNPRSLELTLDTILTAEFAQSFSGQCGENLYWELIETTLHITGSGEMYNYTSDTAPWKLLVSSIKVLTIAENVTKIGYDAFDGCSALESVVWNAKNYTNPANAEAAPFYGITSHIKSFTFGEAVEHIPAYLCDGMEKLTSITTPNSLNTIGTSAFEGCARLAKISLGTGLEEIAANAFAGCTRLYDIYVYATYPPFADESSFANYNVYVYVPCEYQRGYTLDVVWGKFKFIECIESEDATTDGNVTVDPGFNDVTITWPTEDNADNYTIVIEKDGKVFCTLTFNAAGQLLNIAFAPSRDGSSRPVQYAEQAVNGYRFTVTGLDEGSAYIYELVIKDNGDNVLQTYSGEFRTQSIDDRTVTVKYDTMQGEVIGAGTYLLGDTATLTVIPNEGYRFVGWTDGNADNPRTLVVTQDTTLTALFEVLTYDVTVTCDPTQGAVTGSGTYNHGDLATLTAIPNEGYRFVRWSNEVEDNPYIFVISEDVTLSAEFEEIIPSSVENTNGQSPSSNCQKILYEDHIYILREGKIYSVMGQEL